MDKKRIVEWSFRDKDTVSRRPPPDRAKLADRRQALQRRMRRRRRSDLQRLREAR